MIFLLFPMQGIFTHSHLTQTNQLDTQVKKVLIESRQRDPIKRKKAMQMLNRISQDQKAKSQFIKTIEELLKQDNEFRKWFELHNSNLPPWLNTSLPPSIDETDVISEVIEPDVDLSKVDFSVNDLHVDYDIENHRVKEITFNLIKNSSENIQIQPQWIRIQLDLIPLAYDKYQNMYGLTAGDGEYSGVSSVLRQDEIVNALEESGAAPMLESFTGHVNVKLTPPFSDATTCGRLSNESFSGFSGELLGFGGSSFVMGRVSTYRARLMIILCGDRDYDVLKTFPKIWYNMRKLVNINQDRNINNNITTSDPFTIE